MAGSWNRPGPKRRSRRQTWKPFITGQSRSAHPHAYLNANSKQAPPRSSLATVKLLGHRKSHGLPTRITRCRVEKKMVADVRTRPGRTASHGSQIPAPRAGASAVIHRHAEGPGRTGTNDCGRRPGASRLPAPNLARNGKPKKTANRIWMTQTPRRMMAGEEPAPHATRVRRYVRDVVDSRRRPLLRAVHALGVDPAFVMLPCPRVQFYCLRRC